MRYKVDLKRFMADCEANYHRLHRLLHGFEAGLNRQVALPIGDATTMNLVILERTPYTSLVEIRQQGAATPSWLPQPCLKVRLYHDARLAEVVDYGGRRNPRPRHPYPNDHMLQPDEKAQWNRFLAEWLAFALNQGYALAAPELVG